MRLDVYITAAGGAASRSRAQRLIDEGKVYVNGAPQTKASYDVKSGDKVELHGSDLKYVSRGGLKLEAALKKFSIDVSGFVCADIGASTGGFTDCLLKSGAAKVFAIDSGRDQLHESLRNNERVCVMECFNARELEEDDIGTKVDAVVMDVSFISQTLLYDSVCGILKDEGVFISLIKPQFEAGRSNIGKNGIVRDKSIHLDVLRRIYASASLHGLAPISIMRSPIQGGDGNVEYLGLFRTKKYTSPCVIDMEKIVNGS